MDERNRPDPRLIRRPRDAEIAAAEWLRFWGYLDAHTHGPGADGGIDVESKEVVAQVKARVSTAGRPELQQLYGAAAGAGRRAVFFSLGGYTNQAIGWANEVGIALFEFDLQGEPEPMNEPAATMCGLDPSALHHPVVQATTTDCDALPMSVSAGSLPSPAPPNWRPVDQARSFTKYARRLQRNGHRVTGYALTHVATDADRRLVQAWVDAGVIGNYVVVDHETGRVEGYPTWAEAYAATTTWDGGVMAPSVRRSLGRRAEVDASHVDPQPCPEEDDIWTGD